MEIKETVRNLFVGAEIQTWGDWTHAGCVKSLGAVIAHKDGGEFRMVSIGDIVGLPAGSERSFALRDGSFRILGN